MDFVTKHLTYIIQSANCRAIEIAEITGRHGDVEDFRQEILVYLVRRAPTYNPDRGKPTTFISMITTTAKKRMLRRMRRAKNRIITDAIPL
jgi:DNA-directed RNA polymerase specialized sigma24 family protein